MSEIMPGEVYPANDAVIHRLHVEDIMTRRSGSRENAEAWYRHADQLTRRINSAVADMMPVVCEKFLPVQVLVDGTGLQRMIFVEKPAEYCGQAERGLNDSENDSDHSAMHGATGEACEGPAHGAGERHADGTAQEQNRGEGPGGTP